MMAKKDKFSPNPRWYRFSVRQKKGRWVAVFDHISETVEVMKNGRTYRAPRRVEQPLKHEDGSPPKTAEQAKELAEHLYDYIEKARIRAREKGPQIEDTLENGEVIRWPVESAIENWLADAAHPKTAQTNRERIRWFKHWAANSDRQFLDQLTFNDARDFHNFLAAREHVSDRTREVWWKAAHACLRWSVREGRLQSDPWAGVNAGRYTKHKRSRDRVLTSDIAVVYPDQRKQLLAACRTTQERLLLQLYNLIGLRPSEPMFLRWCDFVQHTDPPELLVRHCATRDFKVKTGERRVPIYWEEVLQLLREHHRTTATGNQPNDWIIAKPNGKPYDEAPRSWIERLQAANKEIKWTPTIGRHTAASLLPVHLEKLTGRKWTELEHSKYFGHDMATSIKYYVANDLLDLANIELNPDAGSAEIVTDAAKWPSLTVDLAKAIFTRLFETSTLSKTELARRITETHSRLSDAAISKFLNTGNSIPVWFWAAMEILAKRT